MLKVKQFTFSPVQENTYVIYDALGWCAIIDPGTYFPAEKEELLAFIRQQQLTPKYLLNTHCHLDHVFGNRFCAETFSLPLHLHPLEEQVLAWAPESGKRWGLPFDNYEGPFIFLEEGHQVLMGTYRFDILHTPGHSPGSICYYCAEQGFIISGDVLFRNSVGRTDLPGGDTATLYKSIREKLMVLPDEVIVYSGHGPATTIGQERAHNPYVAEALG